MRTHEYPPESKGTAFSQGDYPCRYALHFAPCSDLLQPPSQTVASPSVLGFFFGPGWTAKPVMLLLATHGTQRMRTCLNLLCMGTQYKLHDFRISSARPRLIGISRDVIFILFAKAASIAKGLCLLGAASWEVHIWV